MTRGHAARPSVSRTRARATRGHDRGGTLLGIFIGLVLGLGLAAGVAYYVGKLNSPYAAQAKDAREPARDSTREAGKGGKDSASPADKPRFDFYKILPGGEEPKVQVERKVAPDRAVIDQAKDKESERTPAKAATEASPKSAGDRFWLQAGSFASESDAENLKAQLAMAGLGSSVQQGTLQDKGVRYRVRLGPYDNTDELNRIKTDLAKKGFDVAVIKF